MAWVVPPGCNLDAFLRRKLHPFQAVPRHEWCALNEFTYQISGLFATQGVLNCQKIKKNYTSYDKDSNIDGKQIMKHKSKLRTINIGGFAPLRALTISPIHLNLNCNLYISNYLVILSLT